MGSRLSQAAGTIFQTFDRLRDPVLRQRDISAILETNRKAWRLALSTNFTTFVKFLTTQGKLRRVSLQFPYRPETLFTWGSVSTLAIAVASKPKAYLCQHTAMELHQLTKEKSRVIYANCEQRPLPSSEGPLRQQAIDTALRRPQRVTKYRARLGKHAVWVLNGKHTDGLGVDTVNAADGYPLRVTGIERTLIDITVRPAYAGGPERVLEAFRRARGRFSVAALATMLKRMAFVYPYHQSIGFYLERAGYTDEDLSHFRTPVFTHDFYLAYAMKGPAYSSSWRLHYPADLR